jgi:hypothetical protein
MSDLQQVAIAFLFWGVFGIGVPFATAAVSRQGTLRFRVHTLLVATTLVSVGLGLIVWLAHAR